MGAGDFNVAGYMAAVGKKVESDVELADRIQPVLVVADLSLNAPLHRPAAGAGGQTLSPGAGNRAAYQVVSLDPGGCLVQAQFLTAAGFMRWRVVAPPSGGFIPIGYVSTLSQNGLPLSTILAINRVAVLTTQPHWFVGSATQPTSNAQGDVLFIPRGFGIEWEHTTDQVPTDASIMVQAIAATQGGDDTGT